VRILVLHQTYLAPGQGGISRFNNLVREWNAAGVACTVVSCSIDNKGRKVPGFRNRLRYVESDDGLLRVVRAVGARKFNRSFVDRIVGYNLFALTALWAGLREKGWDLVLVSSPPLLLGLAGLGLRLFRRKPLVFEVRDLWPESAIDMGTLRNPLAIGLSRWLEKTCYRRAALLPVVTPAFPEAVRAVWPVPEDRFLLVPNCPDLSRMRPNPEAVSDLRRRLGLEGCFVAGYFGNHGISANLRQVVDAAEPLRAHPDIRFLLVGEGMDKPALQDRARELGLDNIHFLDEVAKDQVATYMGAADLCLVSLGPAAAFSRVYPSKMLDAMACERPVLSTVDGAARALLDEAGCGETVPVNRPDLLARRIREMSREPGRLADMGHRGRAYLETHFRLDDMALRYRQALERVAAGGTRP